MRCRPGGNTRRTVGAKVRSKGKLRARESLVHLTLYRPVRTNPLADIALSREDAGQERAQFRVDLGLRDFSPPESGRSVGRSSAEAPMTAVEGSAAIAVEADDGLDHHAEQISYLLDAIPDAASGTRATPASPSPLATLHSPLSAHLQRLSRRSIITLPTAAAVPRPVAQTPGHYTPCRCAGQRVPSIMHGVGPMQPVGVGRGG